MNVKNNVSTIFAHIFALQAYGLNTLVFGVNCASVLAL